MKKLFACALGLAVVLGGCSKAAGPGAGADGRVNTFTIPHVLRYTTDGDVDTLNPHLSQQQTVGLMSSLTMGYLVKGGENNQLYPELATVIPTQANGGVSKDGLTITYHIRHGVRWSDGAPFNADDVVFSTGVVLNMKNNEVGRSGWDRIAKIDEPDKYTVIYHMSKPYSPFVETFFSTVAANPCLLPKHLLSKYPDINHVAYNALPVGIGPFKYQRWDRSQQVVMVANPLYFRGLPKLHEIDFKIIPDRNTQFAQLEAKELDMWFPVPGTYYARVNTLTGFNVWVLPGYIYNHLDFNLTRPADRDPIVRKALRLAYDRPLMVQKISRGMGTIQESTTPVTAPYYVGGIPVTPFDIAKANAMLDKDGWARGADGVRAKNGVKLALELATNSGSPDTDNKIEMVRSDFLKIGVTLNVHRYSMPVLFAPSADGGILFGNTWDLAMVAWQADAIGDFSSLYACDQIPPNGQNDLHWCNAKADAAMHDFYSQYNQAGRNRDVAIFEHELVKDAPTIVDMMRKNIWIVNKDLKGLKPNATSPFDNMMNVDI